MDKTILDALESCGTDVSGALERFANKDSLYEKFLKKFIADSTFSNLKAAAFEDDLDTAKRAAHSMKGVAANLGFIPLQKKSLEIEGLFGEGKIEEARAAFGEAESIYGGLIDILKRL